MKHLISLNFADTNFAICFLGTLKANIYTETPKICKPEIQVRHVLIGKYTAIFSVNKYMDIHNIAAETYLSFWLNITNYHKNYEKLKTTQH